MSNYLGGSIQSNSILNNIINRNEELNKLRANIKGLGDKLESHADSKRNIKQYIHNQGSSDHTLNSQPRLKDFTFHQLQDRTNLNCK